MATALRQIKHDDQLSIVEHLDELRTRIIVCLAAFSVCFAFTFWKNDDVLKIVNHPFHVATEHSAQRGTLSRAALFQREVGELGKANAALARALQTDDNAPPAVVAAAKQVSTLGDLVAKHVPSSQREPVTIGVAEPFTATFKVAAYAALLLSLPLILWQLYAFVLPAFSPTERKAARPLMFAVPFLFIAGAVFAYFIVLPSAIKVLQNFNSDNFDILVQAKDLYRFTILTCIGLGALFQFPIGILLLVRVRILSVAVLRANRRYAILGEAVLAMLLPGTDIITMLLSMLPLFFLYEGSILVAALMERRDRKHAAEHGEEEYGPAWWRDDDDED